MSMLARTSSMQGRCDHVSFCIEKWEEWAYLVFLKTVLKDILDYQTTCLAKCNLMPHSTKSFIDIFHDLRGRLGPSEFEELLPDVTSISMDDGLGDAAKELMNHNSFVILRNGVKRLLNYVTSKSIHRKVQSITANRLCNLNHLLGRSVLKATLDQEVSKAIDHQ